MTIKSQTETKVHGAAEMGVLAQTSTPAAEAKEMLSLFASVGARHSDVTLKNERTNKTTFDRGRTVNGLSNSLPSLLSRSEREQIDIIIRPLSRTPLIQFDDLSQKSIEKIREFSFAIIETSRGNFQAWLAVTDVGEDTARSLNHSQAERRRRQSL